MKIVIAPQAFKGSLTADEAASAIEEGVRRIFPDANILSLPVADGGDGTLDVMLSVMGGQRKISKVKGPLGNLIEAPWGILPDGVTAVIEMAKVCGLTMVDTQKRNPAITTTYGMGEIIREGLDRGINHFFIGVGGSATNDAAAGLAQALGIRLLDKKGNELPIGGASLAHLHKIDISGMDKRVFDASFTVGYDVSNPLLGPDGASHVYAPQKGANPNMVEDLEHALATFVRIAHRDLRVSLTDVSGAGAAGGAAGGMAAFLQAELTSGIDMIMELIDFERHLMDANLVITGEGRVDSQTPYHKAPIAVAKKAKAFNLPVIAIVGSVGPGFTSVHTEGIDAVIPISFAPLPEGFIPKNSAALLSQATSEACRCMKLL